MCVCVCVWGGGKMGGWVVEKGGGAMGWGVGLTSDHREIMKDLLN